MSATQALERIHTQFRTIPGFGPNNVLPYEPASVSPPLIYSVLERIDPVDGPRKGYRYRFVHRLVLRWQDNERAEEHLLVLVTRMRTAIEADPGLTWTDPDTGRRIETPSARESISDYVPISGTMYRVHDLYTETTEK